MSSQKLVVGGLDRRTAWGMLLALSSAFTLSQAFRTMASIMGPPLTDEFHFSQFELGLWAAIFHLSFGGMQLVMGAMIDVMGVRRTILIVFPMTVIGAVLSSQAHSLWLLMIGQLLIGTGCAPAFLVCTVFIGRYFSSERFTAVSGMVMSISGIGIIATSTPLAWMIHHTTWRWGFGSMAICSILAWSIIWLLVREKAPTDAQDLSHEQSKRPSIILAMRQLLGLFVLPQTLGLVLYACVAYAGFLTLRGLWLGPLLVERYGYSLVQSGNVALLMTIMSIASPAVYGRMDRGGRWRVRTMLVLAFSVTLLIAVMGLVRVEWLDVAIAVIYGLLSGYGVLQYGYTRDAYPPEMRGRALSLLTMAMFLGIFLMQGVSGLAANLAPLVGIEPYSAALLTMALLLLLGALGFWLLPRAPLNVD
jgi:MFS family permease